MPRRRPTYTLAARLRRDLASRRVVRRLGRRVFHRLLGFSIIAVWLLLPYGYLYGWASASMLGGQLAWADGASRPFLDTAFLLVPDPGPDDSLQAYASVFRNLALEPIASPEDVTVWNWADSAGLFHSFFVRLPYRLQVHRPGCARVDVGGYDHSQWVAFRRTWLDVAVPPCQPVELGAEAGIVMAEEGGEQ